MPTGAPVLWGNEIIVYHSPIVDMQFDIFSLDSHDYIINSSHIRECNFIIGTTILGKGFAQEQAHTEFITILVL